jgi:predicted nucleic acid-binding protein
MISLVNQYTVVLDACVLAPMPLCDTLLRLAEEPAVYIPKWSACILAEVSSALAKMGYSTAQAARRIQVMRQSFEDAEVQGYEALIPSMTNADKDRHVLAAAVHCGAAAIVTNNIRHFPMESLIAYEIEPLTPDQFLLHQLHLEPQIIGEKLSMQAADLEIPLFDLLAKLARTAPEFVRLIRAEA